MVGYMSNGCIDRDIRLKVVSVLETGGTAKTIRNVAGSSFFDLKLPCGTSLQLFLNASPEPKSIPTA
jgi:xanthine dehydrogenase accessory factor